MKGSAKFLTGVLVGAAAGTAVAVFLSSERGKEMLSGIKDKANKYGDGLKDAVHKLAEKKDELLSAHTKENGRSKTQKDAAGVGQTE